jgi:hypothetical protein
MSSQTKNLHMKNKQTGKGEVIAMSDITQLDYGFYFYVESEIEAYKAAYLYRNSPHGCAVSWAGGVKRWRVTVFNENAVKCNIANGSAR